MKRITVVWSGTLSCTVEMYCKRLIAMRKESQAYILAAEDEFPTQSAVSGVSSKCLVTHLIGSDGL